MVETGLFALNEEVGDDYKGDGCKNVERGDEKEGCDCHCEAYGLWGL